MKKYTELFQVRTADRRLVASCCSVEHAERYSNDRRILWKWIDGAYRALREGF